MFVVNKTEPSAMGVLQLQNVNKEQYRCEQLPKSSLSMFLTNEQKFIFWQKEWLK